MTLTADVLRPHQAEIIRAAFASVGTREEERYLLIYGGRGTMKTSTLTRALGIQLGILTRLYRGYTLLVAAMTYPQLRDVFLAAWTDQVDPADLPWTYNAATATIHLPNEGRIIMRHAGASSSGQLSAEKAARLLKGINAHGFYAPEALALADVFYSATQLAVRAVPGEYRPGMPPYRINWLDANPGGPDHWIHRRFVDPSTPEYVGAERAIVRGYPTTPETSLYAADRIARERAGMPDFVAARDLDAKWAGAMGALYRLYDGVQVTADPLPPGGQWCMGFDWGYEVDPYVCLLAYSHGGHVYVVDELARLRMEFGDICAEVAGKDGMLVRHGVDKVSWIAGDPAGIEHGGLHELRKWRRTLGAVSVNTDNSRYLGWRTLIRSFAMTGEGSDRPLLTIHPRCTGTIAALRSLVWNPKGTDIAPVKGEDPADALRYLAMATRSPLPKS